MASPTVTATKVTPKIVVKGIVERGSHKKRPSKKSPPRLVDELVIDPTDVIQQGATTVQDQSSSVAKETGASSSKHIQTESLKEKEPEGVAHIGLSDADDESSDTESEVDKSKIGVGKSKKEICISSRDPEVLISKGPEAVKDQNFEVPELQQVQSVEKKVDDDEVVITSERVYTPPTPENPTIHIPDDAETSKPKKTTLPGPFEGFPNVQGELKDDILPDEDYDVFHDATIKDLTKKVSLLEKVKAKAEAEHDELKKQLEKHKVNKEMKSVVNDHVERINTLVEDVDDNAKLFEQLSAELSEVNVKYANMNETNQTLHQMLDELHEVSSNEIKVLKLEIEALRADKVVKDEQLNMLYTVMEHHLGIKVQAIYNNLQIQRVEEIRA
ncbi:hypothetical protein Hanom_Chr17g01573171 [Helianthus anomalus]